VWGWRGGVTQRRRVGFSVGARAPPTATGECDAAIGGEAPAPRAGPIRPRRWVLRRLRCRVTLPLNQSQHTGTEPDGSAFYLVVTCQPLGRCRAVSCSW